MCLVFWKEQIMTFEFVMTFVPYMSSVSQCWGEVLLWRTLCVANSKSFNLSVAHYRGNKLYNYTTNTFIQEERRHQLCLSQLDKNTFFLSGAGFCMGWNGIVVALPVEPLGQPAAAAAALWDGHLREEEKEAEDGPRRPQSSRWERSETRRECR